VSRAIKVGETGCRRTVSLLAQPDQALAGVEVIGPQRKRPATSAGGLGVQPQQQRIQLWIIAAVRGGLADPGEPVVGDGPPGRRQAAGVSADNSVKAADLVSCAG
jgi:hypothetical protein